MIATLITLGLVASVAAVYWSPAWAGYYLFAGVWALLFLGLSPLVLKAFMFDRRPLWGVLLLGAKLVLMGLMFVVCLHWSRTESNKVLLGSALVAGLSTLFVVLVLRAIGSKTQGPAGHKPSGGGAPPNHFCKHAPSMESKL